MGAVISEKRQPRSGKAARRQPQKLTVNRETLKDLTPATRAASAVKGGVPKSVDG
jgi:hypothetical protein